MPNLPKLRCKTSKIRKRINFLPNQKILKISKSKREKILSKKSLIKQKISLKKKEIKNLPIWKNRQRALADRSVRLHFQ